MALSSPIIETKDLDGTTTHFNGTVGTTAIAVPASPGSQISDVLVSSLITNTPNKNLLVSFDGGTTFFTLVPGTAFSWSCRSGLTQIHIKGSVASVAYEILMNREP